VHGATPAALIEGVELDPAGAEGREEGVEAVYMVGEAVDEEDEGFWGVKGLVAGIGSALRACSVCGTWGKHTFHVLV